MKRTIAVPNGWALTASLMLALTVLPGEAAQRAVPRGSSGDGQPASSPPPQSSAPAPQGARAPSTSGDSGRAAPRSESSGSSPSAATAPRSDGSSGRTATSGSSGGSAVPYGRPRDGNATGVAVARTGPPPPRGGSDFPSIYYYPTIGYYPWGYGGYGFGGYYGSGYYGSGYYGNGYYGSGYYGGYDSWGYGYPRNYSLAFSDDGALRLKIKPNGASVFVDGYFAGQVDDFDGIFQRLHLEPGPHRIEVRADAFEPLFFDVRILPDRTVTYTGELKRN